MFRFQGEGDVRAKLVVKERRSWFKGCFRISHDRQQIVFNVDQVTGVFSGGEGFSDNNRYRIPYIANVVYGKWSAFWFSETRQRNGIKRGHADHQFRALKCGYDAWK